MNIKKTQIALALSSLLFLSVPAASTFADENHSAMKSMHMGGTMAQIKNELRGYVQGVKGDDAQVMQEHLNELLQLSTLSAEHMPENMQDMDHGTMDMDHSNMEHGDMNMDHSTMDHAGHDMSVMPGMEGMTPEQHQHLMYMHGMTGLNELFQQLDEVQDKAEIKLILGEIKTHLKNNQQFLK